MYFALQVFLTFMMACCFYTFIEKMVEKARNGEKLASDLGTLVTLCLLFYFIWR